MNLGLAPNKVYNERTIGTKMAKKTNFLLSELGQRKQGVLNYIMHGHCPTVNDK